MASIDDEILKGAELDALEMEFIKNHLPQDLKEKFTDEDLYYFLDVILEYFSNAQPDSDGYIDIDLDEVSNYVISKAKKEKMGDYEHDDILLVVQAELDFNETLDD